MLFCSSALKTGSRHSSSGLLMQCKVRKKKAILSLLLTWLHCNIGGSPRKTLASIVQQAPIIEAGKSKKNYQIASFFLCFLADSFATCLSGFFLCFWRNLLQLAYQGSFYVFWQNLLQLAYQGSWQHGKRLKDPPCLLGKSLLSVYRASTDSLLACSAKNPRYDLINLFY